MKVVKEQLVKIELFACDVCGEENPVLDTGLFTIHLGPQKSKTKIERMDLCTKHWDELLSTLQPVINSKVEEMKAAHEACNN